MTGRLSTVTVVGNQVGGSTAWADDLSSRAESLDAGLDGSRGCEALKSDQVSSETSNVRASHGSSADCVGSRVRSDPRGQDVDTRGKNIDDRSVVGERGAVVVNVNSADGDGQWLGGGRVVGGVGVIVSSCDDDGDS